MSTVLSPSRTSVLGLGRGLHILGGLSHLPPCFRDQGRAVVHICSASPAVSGLIFPYESVSCSNQAVLFCSEYFLITLQGKCF